MIRESVWHVAFDSETVTVTGRFLDSDALEAVLDALRVYRDLLAENEKAKS